MGKFGNGMSALQQNEGKPHAGRGEYAVEKVSEKTEQNSLFSAVH